MKAYRRERYGPPEALALREVERPSLVDDGVLVRVRATSVNPVDWYTVTGRPLVSRASFGLLRPKTTAIGVDFAGTVEAVGSAVTHVRPGDRVFGGRNGAFTEYVVARKAVVPMPAAATFEEAAAMPVAGITALQGLRDHGRLQPGQRVLINGASGGVGTFAIQIARALGAEVTAVCSTRNVEQARALGAHRVLDYTRQDFTRSGERYDLLLDVAGSRPWWAVRRVLADGAILVQAGAPKGNPLLGPLAHIALVRLAAARASQKVVFFLADLNGPDLLALRDLVEAGQVTPAVDRRYDFSELPAALRYLGEGHARGKVVVSLA